MFRDSVRHPKIREYAISVLNAAKGNNDNSATITANLATIQGNMKKFLVGSGSTAKPVTFTFNSKTGEAIGIFSYYENGSILKENIEEDVGDMLRSNYIIIQDRNYPTELGKIESWSNTNEITKRYSHRITHDVSSGLTNIQIIYKNMYL